LYDKDNPCLGLKDGDYAMANLFTYMHCSKQVASYHNCGKNEVFDTELKKCVDGSKLSMKKFCDHRADGNYQDPWDCNKFIQCVKHQVFVSPCQSSSLVYDPHYDICRDDLPCKQLKGTQ